MKCQLTAYYDENLPRAAVRMFHNISGNVFTISPGSPQQQRVTLPHPISARAQPDPLFNVMPAQRRHRYAHAFSGLLERENAV
jgi:hypothetical protein